MIKHINKHFNPSNTVNSLSYIFDLIDVKQALDKSVITLKAQFSRLFASLKLRGVAINSALQVGFMLRSILSQYHVVVQDFHLGCHSLASVTLQSVMEQCMASDKDPWKGPVGKDGKPVRTPSAYATGASGNSSNPYESLTMCSFGNHMSCWWASCKDSSKRCMICHNTSNKPAHHSKDCPILKKIGLKLVKRTLANGSNAASRVGHEAPPPAPPTASPAVPNPPAKIGVSAGTPGAFMVATEPISYDSSKEFDYEGKYEGKVYSNGNYKSNIPVYPCTSHASVNILSPDLPLITTSCRHSTSSINPKGVCTVQLPKLVTTLFKNSPAHSIAFMSNKLWPCTSLLAANTAQRIT
jgi:hypothetical protein